MLQVVQAVRSGKLTVSRVPEPLVRPGHVLIQNQCSVISAGTEKMVVDLASKSLLQKARARPDLVRQVLKRLQTQGLWKTYEQVSAKLDEPIALGYASTGIVLACGEDVQQFKPGDRVASNGPHAGIVCVPKHLCAAVPEAVPSEHAAFTILGAIAIQGVRLAQLGLGDTVLVIGLGLIGQIAVMLLKAQGCRVLATDLDSGKCELACNLGADVATPGLRAEQIQQFTGGHGADAVLITAATKSDGPVQLAGDAVRAKGRVVVVGAVGMQLPRKPYYLKEAEFIVSCSYGPGRYDTEYEQAGRDYPYGYVRWTEQRNMQAVLQLMAENKLDVAPLITHRFGIDEADRGYDVIKSGSEPYLGIVLNFPTDAAPARTIQLKASAPASQIDLGCIGAGGFARGVLLPAIRASKQAHLRILCSASGLSASVSGDKLGFEQVCSDEDLVAAHPQVNTAMIVTRHHLHARQVIKCLQNGKHTFVEKPLALTVAELAEIEATLHSLGNRAPLLMVGFNRRFSPAARQVKHYFADVASPLTVSIRFNAGQLPADHWTQDLAVGGGRIIGEACHAIDLATYLIGAPVTRVYAESIGGHHAPATTDDQCFITLRHANGSISNVAYLAGGDRDFPKERIEVLGGGRVAVIDDFREVILSQGGKQSITKSGQDKGHAAEVAAFFEAIQSGATAPISWEELKSTTLASILAVRSLREGLPQELDPPANEISAKGSASEIAAHIDAA